MRARGCIAAVLVIPGILLMLLPWRYEKFADLEVTVKNRTNKKQFVFVYPDRVKSDGEGDAAQIYTLEAREEKYAGAVSLNGGHKAYVDFIINKNSVKDRSPKHNAIARVYIGHIPLERAQEPSITVTLEISDQGIKASPVRSVLNR